MIHFMSWLTAGAIRVCLLIHCTQCQHSPKAGAWFGDGCGCPPRDQSPISLSLMGLWASVVSLRPLLQVLSYSVFTVQLLSPRSLKAAKK